MLLLFVQSFLPAAEILTLNNTRRETLTEWACDPYAHSNPGCVLKFLYNECGYAGSDLLFIALLAKQEVAEA